jgi:hypothetical protein
MEHAILAAGTRINELPVVDRRIAYTMSQNATQTRGNGGKALGDQ